MSGVRAGARELATATRAGVARCAGRIAPRRASAAATTGSVTRGAATSFTGATVRTDPPCGRAVAPTLDTTGAGAAELLGSATEGRGRTTRVSRTGAVGARTETADLTLSPLAF